jgi:hypothetical protein|tara:strand:+ start:454 stop:750 length:297 start_codon:yes stop_codon:yes gene_type:complete
MLQARRGIAFDEGVYEKIMSAKPKNLSLSKYVSLLCIDQIGGRKVDSFFIESDKKLPKLTDPVEFWQDWADSQDKETLVSIFKKTHCISGIMGGIICT